jgi:translation initiation factor IF-2
LNVILKGDVDGSVEALSDSFSKLSTEEFKSILSIVVLAITETDVMLLLLQMQLLSDLMFVLLEMQDN